MSRRLGLVALLILLLGACSSAKPIIKPAEELMAEGQWAWLNQNWDEAAQAYGQVRDYYPYYTQAPLAQLRAAEALFRDGRYLEAQVAFASFEELNPTHPQLPDVMLRIGQCFVAQMPTIDRDPNPAREAVRSIQKLLQRFPDSPQAKKAEAYLGLAHRHLAEHEIYVARFYKKGKKYKAALGRFEAALKYPDTGLIPTIKAELAVTLALAEGKPAPKIKIPEPKPLKVEVPPSKNWLDRTWDKVKRLPEKI